MKRINFDLEKLNLKDDVILSRKQLKQITGGVCGRINDSCVVDSNCCDGLVCLAGLCKEGCEVTCSGNGNFACCWRNFLVAYCKCEPNGTQITCDAGGPGATQCQVDHN